MGARLLPTVDQLPEPLARFMNGLTEEQKLLLVLKRELYDGRWQPMIADLTHRLEGRPYVLRLADRIEDDLKRIEHIAALERQYQVDLSVYLEPLDADARAETD